jgi:hypothetical protein
VRALVCGWLFQQRLAYLDWIIGIRQAQIDAWDAAQDPSDFVATEHHLRLESVQNQRRLELADREPLPEWQRGRDGYLAYLDSPRWKRKRLRKLVSVGRRCESPDCGRVATRVPSPGVRHVGFEENADLVALCLIHHRAAHSY